VDGILLEEGAGVDVARLVVGHCRLISRSHVSRLPLVRLVPAGLQTHEDLVEAVVDEGVVGPIVHVQLAQMLGHGEEFGRHLDHHVLISHPLLHIADLFEGVEIRPRKRRVEIHPHEEERPDIVFTTLFAAVVHGGRGEGPRAAEVGVRAGGTRLE
ncbi:hypothetical protein PFISCL1PPCAC_5235, partial [Pristionchus fissidentatus]